MGYVTYLMLNFVTILFNKIMFWKEDLLYDYDSLRRIFVTGEFTVCQIIFIPFKLFENTFSNSAIY